MLDTTALHGYRLPELLQVSRPLAVAEAGEDRPCASFTLKLFESRAFSAATGCVSFIGGASFAFDWHPEFPGVFATAAHPKDTPTHILNQKYDSAGHIQLWSFDELSGTARCFGLIPFEGHCIWDLQWCPAGFEGSSERFAAVHGNGDVVMYMVKDLKALNVNQRPSVIDFEVRKITDSVGRADMPWSLRWSPDGKKLLVGSTLGDVGLYGISQSSGEATLLWETKHLSGAVKQMKWLSSSRYITVGNDGIIRTWDDREPGVAYHESHEGLNWGLSVQELEEDVYIVCTHTGETKLIYSGECEGEDAVNRFKRGSRNLIQVKGSLRSIVGYSLPSDNAKASDDKYICYCAGSSGSIFRSHIPVNVWKAKFAREHGKIAQFEEEHPASGAESGAMILRMMRSVYNEECEAESKKAKRQGAYLFNYPQSVTVHKLSLSHSNEILAATTNAGFLLILNLSVLGEADTAGKPLELSKAQQTSKKTRGRPRKRPAGEAKGPPRKRGRPRKSTVQSRDDEEKNKPQKNKPRGGVADR